MHELSITERILSVALRHAEAAGARWVISIRLTIDALSDLEGEWVQKYFDHLSKGTIADKAMLRIERAPAVLTCEDCGRTFEVDRQTGEGARCPDCGCARCPQVAGRLYQIEDMQVL